MVLKWRFNFSAVLVGQHACTFMAGKFIFTMDQKDITRFLTKTIDSFIQDRLINKEQRIEHKEQCAERLAAKDGSSDKDTEVEYSDQAVIANLDWGIEALEEAISTYNMETKLARLDHAEKMLQVCAMLNPKQKTAGVPNFYLSAWAHLNLSYLWKLRSNTQNCIFHALEMFIVDPFFSRVDFAPDLWKTLFLPHMSSIVGWYSEERHKLMMEVVSGSANLSFTADLDQVFNESLVSSMRPHQLDKLQKLDQLYGESLNENTRLYAKYYKDCMNSDSTSGKKVSMLPIAEPPMTPLHELSLSIPDYIKFGPILPKSAGFSSTSIPKDIVNERENSASSHSKKAEKSSTLGAKENIIEENENYSESELDGVSVDSDNKNNIFSPEKKMIKDEYMEPNSSNQKNQIYSPNLSPLDSRRTSLDNSSTNPDLSSKREPKILRSLSSRFRDSAISDLTLSPDMSSDHIFNSDNDVMVFRNNQRKNYNHTPSMNHDNDNSLILNDSSICESDDGYQGCISLPKLEKPTSGSKPPKDFVCAITGQIFCDPVTLETGQTYERKAIQEWLRTGNTTCPITRQPLSASALPKTNYVLKRLITSWKEKHPELAQELSNADTPRSSSLSPFAKDIPMHSIIGTEDSPHQKNKGDCNKQKSKRFMQFVVSTSPTSVLSQAAVETIMNCLKPYISTLCTSENLQECEKAVMEMAKLWKDSKTDSQILSYLSKPTIINSLVEILSASMSREVLRTSIYILSDLISADESVGETLHNLDSDFDCMTTLLKNGLAEAAILIYQLRPVYSQLSSHELIPSLVKVIQDKNEDLNDFHLALGPKDAAIAILEQILIGGDENRRSLNALNIISANGIPALLKYLEKMEGRRAIIYVLLCCMQAEKGCKSSIASGIELSPVLELFHAGNDSVRGICVEFLAELVQLNRRTFSNQILQIIKDEGTFSTMHTFLVYLQMAPMEHQLAVASLLLQLDLLVEPRKMSIYREEAVETLIEALWQKDFSKNQIKALDSLLFLIGYVTSSGKSYAEAWLLKIAGFDQPYNALMEAGQLGEFDNDMIETMEDEKKALNSWQKGIAFVLCNHENGSIFKALEECLRSNSVNIVKSCLVLATWLTHMLSTLPETGIREVARKSLLHALINVLHSSKNLEEVILATLSLKAFLNDPFAHEALGVYAKSIYRTLRKLRKYSVVAVDIMKVLLNLKSVDMTELWSCKEVVELDLSSNGEVLSLLYLNGQVLSGHSDGTIKLWDSRKRVPRIIQETHEHTKAVTSLCSSGDRLYSGSLDKTIRVWMIKPDEIICIDVHDVKEAVYVLTANAKLACYVSQGTGVKVYNWSDTPKLINFNKYVKCLAIAGDKLYCGCSGYSIQEVHLSNYTSISFFSGTRKLLGKQTIHSLQIHDGFLFACGSSVDSTAGKVFSLSTKMVVGSLLTGFDIHRVAINSDFIFAGTKYGTIEVWLKDKLTQVASIKMAGGHTKITSLVSDADGMMLYVGSSDGKIQVWALD
ncbi:PREDICTED: putative E3 ubiquitin-protein ligase LIN-1 isoform X2 [Lupinus angustifolius]|uniref:putative E3 ubiquitin-protein ligase LIN-1 isoform X2 n=1 Tax=Lupinus angustifolius TaxID=3871 RepID=UPI00092FB8D2|nr:PREDICTED: putative E3 ubiquitin-protein ligase LIN-1 isoform X2 [Lupinus angustifolius]